MQCVGPFGSFVIVNACYRLNLPGEVVEDDRANASYDVNTG